MNDRIDTFINQWNARDLIEWFDVNFDIPNRHQHCIGMLEMLGAFEQSGALDVLKTAERVGAWWCRIIYADVSLKWLDGLNAIEASRADADRLRAHLLSRPVAADQQDGYRQFVAYATARWHDGAGKILYRCADYSGARLSFAAATQICKREELWYCVPDLQSNWLRGEFEERGQAAYNIRLDQRYRRYIRLIEREARSRCIQLPWTISGAAQPDDRLRREFLRGLASLYHNLSVELMRNKDREGSRRCSGRAEAICRQLHDEYRLGQALNHQAFLALGDNDNDRARKLFQDVLQLSSVRAQRIARQNLAGVDDSEGNFTGAVGRLVELLDILRAERSQYSDNGVFDTALHFGTADRLGRLLEKGQALRSAAPKEWDRLRKLQAEEYIEGLRAVRRVVKVAHYKQSFAAYHYPIFLDLIGKSVERVARNTRAPSKADVREQTLSLIEETSSRELLDLLGAGGAPVGVAANLMATGPIPRQASKASGVRRRSAVLRRGLSGGDSNDDKVRHALQVRQKYYEEQAALAPIKTLPRDPEIGYDLRMFSANQPGLVVVRYFLYNADRRLDITGAGRRSELAAVVIRNGELRVVHLDWRRVQALVLEEWRIITEAPRALTQQVARNLFKLLVEPLWDEIRHAREQDDCHVVFVPTDELFSIPLHLAMPDDRPVCAMVPVSYSTSATAFLRRGRHLLRRHRVEDDDDLCAVVICDDEATGKELCGLDWCPKHLLIAGDPPPDVGQHAGLGKADWRALKRIAKKAPEYFVYSGHGVFYQEFSALGPALLLDTDIITQYDVAVRLRLPHNKLTLIGACVSGQGSYGGGGEVSGFLRSFIAAGAGALGVTLWPVRDEDIVWCTRRLLMQVQHARRVGQKTFDLVTALFSEYRDVCDEKDTALERMEACPVALYL